MKRRERLEFRMELAELIGDVFQELADKGGTSLDRNDLRAPIDELRVAAHAVAQRERDAVFKLIAEDNDDRPY
jgi:hypothetical protein